MLQHLRIETTIPYHDLTRALAFYEGTLGLAAREVRSGYAFFTVGEGTTFVLYPSGGAGTAQHTVFTFMTDDIAPIAADLRARGVVFEEYDFPGLKTIDGIADIDDGRVAWFKDSEGNLLAITQRA